MSSSSSNSSTSRLRARLGRQRPASASTGATAVSRRRALGLLGGGSFVALAGSGLGVTSASASPVGSQRTPSGVNPTAGSATIDVRAYGATGNGTTDDTAAIDAAFAASASQYIVYFPEGTYCYNGKGLDSYRPYIVGAGQTATTVVLGASSYLVNTAKSVSQVILRGIKTQGGRGAIRFSSLAASVNEMYMVEECYFSNYTKAAISHNAPDMPYWKIRNNIFNAANNTGTIGIALSGLSNTSSIETNAFWTNRVHVKVRNGQDLKIRDNDFLRYGPPNGVARVDLWCVPVPTDSNAYTGMEVTGNKFGNENLAAGDYRVLFADEDTTTGSDNSSRWPDLASNSTGFVTAALFTNRLYGADPIYLPYVYSTTPNVFGCTFSFNTGGSTPPTYYLKYRVAPPTAIGNVYLAADVRVAFTNGKSLNLDGRFAGPVVVGGSLVADSAAGGVVLKDTAGHYWRLTLSTSGTLKTTDLGKARPKS